MYDERIDAGGGDRGDEACEELVVVVIVDADAAFDGHRQRGCIAHRPDAIGHQRGPQHETGAEGAILDPIAGAAHIEIDLYEARRRTDLRGRRQLLRIAAAQLQGDRVLGRAMLEQAARIAAQERGRHDHLGVQKRVRREQAMDVAAVAVGPVHHRCNR